MLVNGNFQPWIIHSDTRQEAGPGHLDCSEVRRQCAWCQTGRINQRILRTRILDQTQNFRHGPWQLNQMFDNKHGSRTLTGVQIKKNNVCAPLRTKLTFCPKYPWAFLLLENQDSGHWSVGLNQKLRPLGEIQHFLLLYGPRIPLSTEKCVIVVKETTEDASLWRQAPAWCFWRHK